MATQHPPMATIERPHRGIGHLLHPQILGAIIGGAGASAFVNVNVHVLPAPWPSVSVVAWLFALVLCAWAVLLRPRRLRDLGPPRPHAGAVYTASIVGMLAAFTVGRLVLVQVGRPELMPAVVVMAVGLHFVPFAAAFEARVFAVLGWSLAAIGLVGLLLGLAGGAVPVAAAAVVTGVVMLLVMTVDAVRGDQAPA